MPVCLKSVSRNFNILANNCTRSQQPDWDLRLMALKARHNYREEEYLPNRKRWSDQRRSRPVLGTRRPPSFTALQDSSMSKEASVRETSETTADLLCLYTHRRPDPGHRCRLSVAKNRLGRPASRPQTIKTNMVDCVAWLKALRIAYCCFHTTGCNRNS